MTMSNYDPDLDFSQQYVDNINSTGTYLTGDLTWESKTLIPVEHCDKLHYAEPTLPDYWSALFTLVVYSIGIFVGRCTGARATTKSPD